jgi:hypothetical protein
MGADCLEDLHGSGSKFKTVGEAFELSVDAPVLAIPMHGKPCLIQSDILRPSHVQMVSHSRWRASLLLKPRRPGVLDLFT